LIRKRLRFYATLMACIFGFGAIGGLLAWVLRDHPTLELVTLGLVVLGGGLAWWKWSGSDQEAGIRRWFEYRWRRV
jgi:hypothetical protein